MKKQGDGLKRKDFSGLEKQGSQQMLPKQGLRVEKKGRVKKNHFGGWKKRKGALFGGRTDVLEDGHDPIA